MKSYIIITGCIFFALIYAICCYLIWTNRADVKAFSLFGKSIILPALIAIGLLLNELWLTPTVEEKRKTSVLLIHNNGLRVADFSNIEGVGKLGYRIPNSILNNWKSSHDKKEWHRTDQKKSGEFYLDLVVASFLNWVAFTYQQHWDSLWQDKVNLFGGQMLSIRKAEDAEYSPYELTWNSLKAIIPENAFIQAGPAAFVYDKIYLPSGTKIIFKKRKNYRKISFQTKCIDLSVQFSHSGGEDLEASDLGKKIKPLLNLPNSTNYTSAGIYPVSFNYRINPWRRWSFSTKKQLKWARNLGEGFNHSFDWQMIWERLELLGIVPKQY